MNLDRFNDALLELDAEIRRMCLVRDPTERQRDLYERYKHFLAEVAPVRMDALVRDTGGDAEIDTTALAFERLRRMLDLAQDAGVRRSEIVALVNHETIEQAHG